MMSYKKLPSFLLFSLRVFALQCIIFSVFRIIFYFFLVGENTVGAGEKLIAFRRGIEFDQIVICYALLLPFLLLFINSFLKNSSVILSRIAFIFVAFIFIIYDFICVANIPYFLQFGSHLSKQAFLWNSDAGFVVGMVFDNFSYWGYLLLFALILLLFLFLLKRIWKKYKNEREAQTIISWRSDLLYGLTGITLIIIGCRGNITRSTPTHEGFAVISNNGFVNQLALNPNYTLLKSVFYYKTKKYTPPENIEEYISFTRKYLGIQAPYEANIYREVNFTGAPAKMNVVVVVMESMSVYKMGFYNGKKLTPCLDSIISESVFFDNFFSTGIHTFNGLFSTSAGYPAVMDEKSLMHYTRQPFNCISNILRKNNYSTYFFTTQNPSFDNMEGFFKINGFNNIIGESEYASDQSISVLGIPDHLLFEKFINLMNTRGSSDPFFSFIMTSSDHGPWKIPDNIPFKPNSGNQPDNSTMYADWSLGKFMREAKQQEWYSNTLFLFLGDHGLSLGHTYEMPLSYNHVPLVIHQPLVLKPDTINSVGYQPDVGATIMALLNQSYVDETFGIDILHHQHPFVMFSADDKLGAVDNRGDYFYSILNNDVKRLRHYKNLDPADFYLTNKATADSLQYGANAILETARYLIHKKYYAY